MKGWSVLVRQILRENHWKRRKTIQVSEVTRLFHVKFGKCCLKSVCQSDVGDSIAQTSVWMKLLYSRSKTVALAVVCMVSCRIWWKCACSKLLEREHKYGSYQSYLSIPTCAWWESKNLRSPHILCIQFVVMSCFRECM